MALAPLLQGEHIRLTAFDPDADLSVYAGWYADAEFMRLYDAAPANPKNAGQLKARIDTMLKAKDGFLFAVRRVGDDALIGVLELDGILWAHGVAWISIALGDRRNWGKGYGRAAIGLALAFAFDELNLHRVQLTVFSYNTRAIALYEGLGFRREGVYREFLHRDGARHDMLLYGLLAREWRAQRERAAS